MRAESCKIGVQVCLKFIHENKQFALVKFTQGFNISRIDKCGALPLHGIERLLHKSIDCIIKAEVLPRDPNARPFQTIGITETSVVRQRLALTIFRS